jgi:hypothetical protein
MQPENMGGVLWAGDRYCYTDAVPEAIIDGLWLILHYLCPAAIGHFRESKFQCVFWVENYKGNNRLRILDVQPAMRPGIWFWVIGEAESLTGSLEQKYKQLGELSGIAGFKFTRVWMQQEAALLFAEASSSYGGAWV